MPDVMKIAKAELRELDASFTQEINKDKWVTVQFNPETLKVNFSNNIVKPAGGGDQTGTPSLQYVGEGSTSLSVQLWFDLTVPLAAGEQAVSDVRQYTEKVVYFITPTQKQMAGNTTGYIPPAVRFLWGSFQFDGVMDSLNESLEFFSNEGIPLRASISISLSQQKIQQVTFRSTGVAGGVSSAGTSATTLIKSGDTIQGIVDSVGGSENWQPTALANGIENPRLPPIGRLIHVSKLF
jgi:contractile injection system tube protein